jgi:hypothetical protein
MLPNMAAYDNSAVIARRYRDIIAAVADDQGGANRISEARLQLTHRFAAVAVLAERMETRLVRGEEIDTTEHALLCTTLVRIAQSIGLDRLAGDHQPTFADYLRSEEMEKAE